MEPEMPKIFESDDLRRLELWYDELDLYYSFCKTMNNPFDEGLVRQLKYDVSERINKLLKSELKGMRKKCSQCGCLLPWDHPYGMCEECYGDIRRYNNYDGYYDYY
jgi:ATP-dependent RNA helicase SUPV3L1/SUV3